MSKEYLFNLDVKYPGEDKLKRKAYRVQVPGLKLSQDGSKITFPVFDLSATGVAFDPGAHKHNFVQGAIISVSLWWKNKLIMEGLKARIVRVANKLVACEFEKMDYKQELKLDKLILEVQKKMIALKKKSGK